MRKLAFPEQYRGTASIQPGSTDHDSTLDFFAVGSKAACDNGFPPGGERVTWLLSGLASEDFTSINLPNTKHHLGSMYAETRFAALERERKLKIAATYFVRLSEGIDPTFLENTRLVGIVSLMQVATDATVLTKVLKWLQEPFRGVTPVSGEPRAIEGWVRADTADRPEPLAHEVLATTVDLARSSGVTALHASVTPYVREVPMPKRLVSVGAFAANKRQQFTPAAHVAQRKNNQDSASGHYALDLTE